MLSVLGPVRVKHQMHYTGRRVFPIHASGVASLQLRFSDKASDAPEWVRLKALVWFWIIDETLVLTSILSVCRVNEVGTCQVM